MKETIKQIADKIKLPFSWHQVRIFLLILIFVLLVFGGSSLVYNKIYEDRVLPGLKVGHIAVGGMTKEELSKFLEKMNDKMVNNGLTFNYEVGKENKSLMVYPVLVSEGGSIDLIRQDTEKETDFLLNYGKEGNLLSRTITALKVRLSSPDVPLTDIYIDRENMISTLKENLSTYEQKPVNANVSISTTKPLNYEVTSSSVGFVFDYDQALTEAINQWQWLETVSVSFSLQKYEPQVLEKDVQSITNRLGNVIGNGDIKLTFKDPQTNLSRDWSIDLDKIKNLIEVQPRDNSFVFGLNKDHIIQFLQDSVTSKINIQPQNAKFETDAEGRVIEFQGSRSGVEVDLEKTYEKINNAFIERTLHDEGITKVVAIEVKVAEPKINTGDVNDLGISEVLGVGISDYSNSPTNRIKNIRNAVNKLNGILVKPGDIFSTLDYTRPFTLDGGYFPELVIKGDEMKAEIGGGLCQIGTTLFRMAMNAGMEIVERRNHSLVISHYNDPVNHLPGTDATVYDPAPDFKFKNDTGNYILIQTYMDTANEELVFTLWGTNDGRQGSYTHPVVDQWIPYGEPTMIETTKLSPGQQSCQNAFRGANTHFTYTRKLADGSIQERLFESHYRPLQRICLVGVAELTPITTSTVESVPTTDVVTTSLD